MVDLSKELKPKESVDFIPKPKQDSADVLKLSKDYRQGIDRSASPSSVDAGGSQPVEALNSKQVETINEIGRSHGAAPLTAEQIAARLDEQKKMMLNELIGQNGSVSEHNADDVVKALGLDSKETK